MNVKHLKNLKTTYHDAGQFYWGRAKTWIKDKVIFNKNSKIVEIDYLNFMDINYLEDFNLAMKLYKTVFSKNEK